MTETMTKPKTKIQKVKEHLLSGRPITAKESWLLYGYQRLADGIHKLRKKGLPIVKRKVELGGSIVALYYIPAQELERVA